MARARWSAALPPACPAASASTARQHVQQVYACLSFPIHVLSQKQEHGSNNARASMAHQGKGEKQALIKKKIDFKDNFEDLRVKDQKPLPAHVPVSRHYSVDDATRLLFQERRCCVCLFVFAGVLCVLCACFEVCVTRCVLSTFWCLCVTMCIWSFNC